MKAGAISFETRTTDEVMGPRKDRNITPFRLTKSWCHPYASTLNPSDLRYVEDNGYWGINLG